MKSYRKEFLLIRLSLLKSSFCLITIFSIIAFIALSNSALARSNEFLGVVPWGTYFRTEGRDIIAESTGEKVVFRGVNLNGLEFGAFYDRPYPGREGINYFKPRPQDFDSLKAIGFNVIRVPFEWARLVPGWRPANLPATLDSSYLKILKDVVGMAAKKQIYVILDMHDYLKYWSGQNQQVCVFDHPDHQRLLSHTWKLIATNFRDSTSVLGYDIMNEPVRREAGIENCNSCNWPMIAQSVVNDIRLVDKKHLIFGEGPNYSLASDWPVENGKRPSLIDGVIPSRIVYSPHVYLDFDNDSRYEQGEETGPKGQWQYYIRDRLIPAIDWSIDNNVPLYFGELGVPCTADWAALLDSAFVNFFDPLHLSVTVWNYLDPAKDPLSQNPLNLLACNEKHQLKVLKQHLGGVYIETGSFKPTPLDSRIYDKIRVNPWDAGDGFWGNVMINFCASDPVFPGNCSISVRFSNTYDGVKFVHHFGLDTRRFVALRFKIYLGGSGRQNFKVFTTAPVSDCETKADPEFPIYEKRRELRQFLPNTMPNIWHDIVIPLDSTIIDPREPIISGIAFQNMGMNQDIFFLKDIRFVPDSTITLVAEQRHAFPVIPQLRQNYPNPFNSSTTIAYVLPTGGKVTLKIFDALGRTVTTLLENAQQPAGELRVSFQARDFASGIYYTRLIFDGQIVDHNRLIFVK